MSHTSTRQKSPLYDAQPDRSNVTNAEYSTAAKTKAPRITRGFGAGRRLRTLDRSSPNSLSRPSKEQVPHRAFRPVRNDKCVRLVSDSIHKRPQLPRARGMPQFAQCFGFDLADAFAGYSERLPDLFQSVLAAVFETEAHLDDFFFARGQRAQDLSRLVLEVHVDHGFGRRDYGAVFDEVAKMRIFLFANRRFEGDRLLRDLENFPHLRHRNVHALGDFFAGRFASQLLHQLPRGADQLVDRLDHVHRDTNRTRLVGNGTSNRLPNPPRGVRRKFVATAVFELVDGLHQADVAFLNQVEELQAAVGVLFRDRNHETEVGLDQLALGLLRVHVALDDLALRALDLLEQQAGFDFEFFNLASYRAGLAAIFFFLILAARGVGFALQVLSLPVKRPHAVDGFVDPVDQALAFGVGKAEFAHSDGNPHNSAGEVAASAAMVLGTLLQRHGRVFFLHHGDFFVQLRHGVDLAGKFVQPVLQDFVGDLLLIEGHDFLDGAHTFLEILAHRQQFVNHDRRSRERLQHADLAALDALGDFHFAFAGEQGNGSHLAQVHADGIVGFFQCAGREVEFDILALFAFVEFLIERGGRQLWTFQHVDALRADRREQVVQVFGTYYIVRDELVDLVISEISLLFPGINQLFYVVVLVFKSQEVFLKFFNSLARERMVMFSQVGIWAARSCAPSTNLQSLAHKCCPVYHLPRRSFSRPPLSLTPLNT